MTLVSRQWPSTVLSQKYFTGVHCSTKRNQKTSPTTVVKAISIQRMIIWILLIVKRRRERAIDIFAATHVKT